jgi:SAM-dependent methyltransferase
MTPGFKPYTGPTDAYEGDCPVCGERAEFTRDRLGIAESFHCNSCRASLRYQGQARAILRAFARRGAKSIAELVEEPEFRRLRIFEPGSLGPLRRYLRRLECYERSEYAPDASPGERRDGVRCEDLMRLSFEPESFDLVITSDIFEHVRHPYRAFAEVHRVLRAGGMHIFTVPCYWPMRASTIARVDVSGAEDVLLMEPAYHGRNGEHLVYNDFGLDMLDRLEATGFVTDVTLFASASETTSRQATFCSVRPLPRDAPVEARVPDETDELRTRRRPRRFNHKWLSRSQV